MIQRIPRHNRQRHVIPMRTALPARRRTFSARAATRRARDCCVPLEGGYGLLFRIMGRPLQKRSFPWGGGWKTVSPGFFEVFGM
jgi:hypothetical protein